MAIVIVLTFGVMVVLAVSFFYNRFGHDTVRYSRLDDDDSNMFIAAPHPGADGGGGDGC